MGWIEERAGQRAHRSPMARGESAIALAMSYAPASDPLALADEASRADLGLCPGRRLSQDGQEGAESAGPLSSSPRIRCELKVFVDTAPVMEKPLAQAAGIGWQGKHTNLLNREPWQLAVPRDHLHHAGARPRRARPRRALRSLHALPRRVPDRRLRRPAPDRCPALHLLPHDRAFGPDSGRVSQRDRQPHLRLRRLSGGMPVEPLRRRRGGQSRLPPSRPGSKRRPWPICSRSTMPASGRCSPARRSSGSGSRRMIRNCLVAAGNSGDRGAGRPGRRGLRGDDDPVVAEAGALGARSVGLGLKQVETHTCSLGPSRTEGARVSTCFDPGHDPRNP